MDTYIILNQQLITSKISNSAFRLYCLLESYCFDDKTECFPSQFTLGQRLNRSVRSIQRYLAELRSAGLIAIKRRGSISNLYTLLRKVILKKKQKTNEFIERVNKNIFNNKSKKNYFNSYSGQRKYSKEELNILEQQLLGRL